ncbi:MAG: hypothetical protein HQL97_10815 [Magnetococcales bacterium]|nr:hypothetical protein [Magnetococcales bacterium]
MEQAPSVSFEQTSQRLLQDPQVAAMYLEECRMEGDPALIQLALEQVADAQVPDP